MIIDNRGATAQEGGVIRADVHLDPTGRPKGTGIVAFETPNDARNAIQQFHGYDWQGRALEVREDRFANSMGGGFGARGGFGGFGGRGGFAPRGGFAGRGGYGGGYAGRGGGFAPGGFGGGPAVGGGAPYVAEASNPPNPFTDFATSGGERGTTIYVRNVSLIHFAATLSTDALNTVALVHQQRRSSRAFHHYWQGGAS